MYNNKFKSVLHNNSTVGFGWVENLVADTEGVIRVESV